MKVLYQCEKCGQIFENPSEAILCEENGPAPKYKPGERVKWWTGSGDPETNSLILVVKSVVLDTRGLMYRLEYLEGGDFGLWSESTLSKE